MGTAAGENRGPEWYGRREAGEIEGNDAKIQKFFRSRWSMIVLVGVVLTSTFVNGLIVKRQQQR